MTALNIPMPDIANWAENDLDVYSQNAQSLALLSASLFSNNDCYREQYQQIQELGLSGQCGALLSHIKDSTQALAFCDLWIKDHNFFKCVGGLHPEWVKALLLGQERLSPLILSKLIHLYFERFGQIYSSHYFNWFCNFIQNQLQLQLNSSDGHLCSFNLARVSEDAALIFSQNAVWNLFDKSKPFRGLIGLLKYYKLESYRYTQLVGQCNLLYGIVSLSFIPLGSEDLLLENLTKYKDRDFLSPQLGPQLGHATLRVMIHRNLNKPLSQYWLNTIFNIARDPRIVSGNPDYQKWWAKLGSNYINPMNNWLSLGETDILLDLLIHRSHNIYQNNPLLNKHFNLARQFLAPGNFQLYRLFLCNYDVQYISQYIRPNRSAKIIYSSIKDGYDSFVYLVLTSGYHVIIGTDLSGPIWLSGQQIQRFSNYGITSFSRDEFRQET